jgi:hypothetical protein
MTAVERKGSKFITPEWLLPAIRAKREREGTRAMGLLVLGRAGNAG